MNQPGTFVMVHSVFGLARARSTLAILLLAAACSTSDRDGDAKDDGGLSSADGSPSSSSSSGGSGADATTDAARADASRSTGADAANDGSPEPTGDCTKVPPASHLVDSRGGIYTLVGGQIARNGVIDPRTAEVILLELFGGLLYQENQAGNWYSTNGDGWPNSTWTTLGMNADPCSMLGGPDASGSDGAVGPTPPAQAAAAGFHTLVYDQGGAAGWNIDVNSSGNPGFALYQSGSFYGAGAGNPQVSNGILTMTENGLVSATGANNAKGYVGYAFGGGYYTEAAIAIDVSCVANSSSWPAFWSNAVEAEVQPGVTDQWPGQAAGYVNYVELDYMEFWQGNPPYYTFAQIDWFGIWNSQACPKFCNCANDGNDPLCGGGIPANNVQTVPAGTSWSNFNIFGALVVPSQLNGAMGYSQGYFNNTPNVSRVTWAAYNPALGAPPQGSQVYAVIDDQHFYLILSTTPGCPIQVSSIRVWQAP
jgi:hypothetical protein